MGGKEASSLPLGLKNIRGLFSSFNNINKIQNNAVILHKVRLMNCVWPNDVMLAVRLTI